MMDDAECLRRYSELRDEAAFTEFVRRHLDLVYSAAFRQAGGDQHLAEDIAQKVFAAAAQRAPALCRHPVIGAWLYQTTRYTAIDALRSRQRQQAREKAFAQMTEDNSGAGDGLDWDKMSPELDKIISSLGERDRVAVVLRFFGGKSFAEIGAQLGLSENAARMRVDRALEKLRLRLSRLGLNSSCAALTTILAQKGIMAAPAALAPTAVAAALGLPVAASGLGTFLGTLHFMSSIKITLGVATLATIASFTVAVLEHNRARSADQALAEALRARPAVQNAAPSSSPPPPALRDQPLTAASAPTVVPESSASPFAAMIGMLKNPIFQKQTELSAKVRLDTQYSALFKRLSLPPATIGQFKALLVEKQMVGFDSMVIAQQHGIDPGNDPQGFFRAIGDAQTTVDAQISALLGSDSYRRFQLYQETIPARNTTHLLTEALSYTATPLTDTQTEAVVQALTRHGTPPLPPSNPFAVFNGDLGVTQLTTEGLREIESTLSPAQVAALQDKILEQRQLFEVRQRMGR